MAWNEYDASNRGTYNWIRANIAANLSFGKLRHVDREHAIKLSQLKKICLDKSQKVKDEHLCDYLQALMESRLAYFASRKIRRLYEDTYDITREEIREILDLCLKCDAESDTVEGHGDSCYRCYEASETIEYETCFEDGEKKNSSHATATVSDGDAPDCSENGVYNNNDHATDTDSDANSSACFEDGVNKNSSHATDTGSDGNTPDCSENGVNNNSNHATDTDSDANSSACFEDGVNNNSSHATDTVSGGNAPACFEDGVNNNSSHATDTVSDGNAPDCSENGVNNNSSHATDTDSDANSSACFEDGVNKNSSHATDTVSDENAPDCSENGVNNNSNHATDTDSDAISSDCVNNINIHATDTVSDGNAPDFSENDVNNNNNHATDSDSDTNSSAGFKDGVNKSSSHATDTVSDWNAPGHLFRRHISHVYNMVYSYYCRRNVGNATKSKEDKVHPAGPVTNRFVHNKCNDTSLVKGSVAVEWTKMSYQLVPNIKTQRVLIRKQRKKAYHQLQTVLYFLEERKVNCTNHTATIEKFKRKMTEVRETELNESREVMDRANELLQTGISASKVARKLGVQTGSIINLHANNRPRRPGTRLATGDHDRYQKLLILRKRKRTAEESARNSIESDRANELLQTGMSATKVAGTLGVQTGNIKKWHANCRNCRSAINRPGRRGIMVAKMFQDPYQLSSNPRKRKRTAEESSRSLIDFPYVVRDAKTFKVYNYVQRRINDTIELCTDNNCSPTFCSESIIITFPDDLSTTSNTFHEALSDIQYEPIETILDKDPSVIVTIGANEERFATLRQKAEDKPMPPVICKITSTYQTDIEDERIKRKPWGFECYAKDLSKDNVMAYIDNVLENYAFAMLDRATEHLPESGEQTSRVLAQVRSFYDPQMPEPELLKKETPEQKATKMEQISKKILALPQVFACDISRDPLRVMILEKNEKALEEITNTLKMMGLADEEYFVQIVKVEPLSNNPYTVLGSGRRGTLGGFAKFKYNNTDTTHNVAITARHVVYPSQLCVDGQVIGRIMEEESPYDITIAEVDAKSKYDTRFRKENGEMCFANLYDLNHDTLRNKAVHFWGATTGLAKANISEIRIGESFAGGSIIIKMSNQGQITFARPGDSGAMILMEPYPRCPESMYAIGTLVGEVIPRKEKNAGKSANASQGNVPVTKQNKTAVQVTTTPVDQENPMLPDDYMQSEESMPSEQINPENPSLQEDPTQSNDFTHSTGTISSENLQPSEDKAQSTDPVQAESPISFEGNIQSKDPSTTEGAQPMEGSLPIYDDLLSPNPTASSDTSIEYAIVPLKKAFEYLSKKHGGSLTLFDKV